MKGCGLERRWSHFLSDYCTKPVMRAREREREGERERDRDKVYIQYYVYEGEEENALDERVST